MLLIFIKHGLPYSGMITMECSQLTTHKKFPFGWEVVVIRYLFCPILLGLALWPQLLERTCLFGIWILVGSMKQPVTLEMEKYFKISVFHPLHLWQLSIHKVKWQDREPRFHDLPSQAMPLIFLIVRQIYIQSAFPWSLLNISSNSVAMKILFSFLCFFRTNGYTTKSETSPSVCTYKWKSNLSQVTL